MKTRATEYKIAAGDFETDPFEFDKIVEPFAWGFYDGMSYTEAWGDDAPETFLAHIRTLQDPHIIYFHNGGKFDFFVGKLVQHFDDDIRIINARIVQAFIGIHQFRDSYAILPFPLSEFSTHKDQDFSIFKRGVREKHRLQIREYMKRDVLDLHLLCSEYRNQFGDALTVGQSAIRRLAELHPFDRAKSGFDAVFRKFYFGGRCQCFRTGVIKGSFKLYDVNNMYGAAMANTPHPIGTERQLSAKITKETDFACIEAKNYGALPSRTPTGGLDFTRERGIFFATIHEIIAGVETGTLKIERVKHAYAFKHKSTFATFVEQYADARAKHKQNFANDGDLLEKARALFIKYLVNSSYGKLSQDPTAYFDWLIRHEAMTFPDSLCEFAEIARTAGNAPLCPHCKNDGKIECPRQWQIGETAFDWILWRRQSAHANYYNVAAGASITGAARAMLLRGLAVAKNPLYCDTDSIIAESLDVEIDAFKLGAWKVESQADTVAIAAKKLYAMFSRAQCVKKAAKGVAIGADQIMAIAADSNATVQYRNPAPRFKLNGTVQFISRKVRQTGERRKEPVKIGGRITPCEFSEWLTRL